MATKFPVLHSAPRAAAWQRIHEAFSLEPAKLPVTPDTGMGKVAKGLQMLPARYSNKKWPSTPVPTSWWASLTTPRLTLAQVPWASRPIE